MVFLTLASIKLIDIAEGVSSKDQPPLEKSNLHPLFSNKKGVEIGDVLCSKSSGDKDFSLVHYEGGKKNNRSKLKSLGMEQEARLNTSLNVLQKSLLDEPRLLKKYLKAGMRYLENQNLNSSV